MNLQYVSSLILNQHPRRYSHVVRVAALLLILVICALGMGCPQLLIQSDDDLYTHNEVATEFISAQFTGNDTEIQAITTDASSDRARTIQLTVNSGQNPVSSLFLQFTNTSNEVSVTPKVRIVGGANNIVRSLPHLSSSVQHEASPRHEVLVPKPLHVIANPPSIPLSPLYSSNSSIVNPPETISASSVAEGESRNFKLHLLGKSEKLYARATRTIGDWSVVAWVHPDVYDGCNGNQCLSQLLNQSDINSIMDVFFKNGNNNDIFDWVTALTGPPWGEHGYDGDEGERNQIISGDTRTINLIFTDIGKKGYSARTVVGYFAGADTEVSSENKALVLYLHAPWAKFDTTESQQKDIFYYYFLSVLAHEFQHLVHFYQRTLLFNRGPSELQDPTWLNEQYSLIIEDIVAQRIIGSNINGLDDRGVNGTSAGTYPICYGRLPDFAAQSYYGISRWGNTPANNEPFINYATNYSFGNFLLRNYNGAAYIDSSYSHNGDPITTIEAGLGDDTLADAISKWGTAILLSDNTNAPSGYILNRGNSGFNFNHDGVSYSLGSTNYYNYGTANGQHSCNIENASGVFAVFNDTERLYYLSGNEQHGHSNIFYEAGKNFSGVVEFVITLPATSRLSVIAKRQQNTNNPNPVYF